MIINFDEIGRLADVLFWVRLHRAITLVHVISSASGPNTSVKTNASCPRMATSWKLIKVDVYLYSYLCKRSFIVPQQ